VDSDSDEDESFFGEGETSEHGGTAQQAIEQQKTVGEQEELLDSPKNSMSSIRNEEVKENNGET